MLTTQRLIIKNISLEDIPAIHQLHSLPETDLFNTLGIPASVQVTTEIVKIWIAEQLHHPRKSFVLGVWHKEPSLFIGLIAISLGKSNFRNAEVWYKIHVDHWNKGYTTEALASILTFGFTELNLHRIEAGCAVDNLASIRVLEKAGMAREGMKRKNLPIRAEWHDSYFYAILKEE